MDERPIFGDRYRILWRRGATGQVGEVRNYADNVRRFRSVPIVLDDAEMKRIGMRFLKVSCDDNGPEMMVSDAFIALPAAFREAGIWHEMGHVHHEHYFDEEMGTQEQLRQARLDAVNQGKVLPQELQADQFALQQVGSDAMIGFLTHLLHTRPKDISSSWNAIGARELELRIAAIRGRLGESSHDRQA